MNGMGAIEHLTIAVSAEAAQKLRARVASGDYSDVSAVIEDALASLDAFDEQIESILPELDEAEVEHWVKTVVVPILEEHDRNPGDVLTADEVRAHLEAARRARAGG